VIVLKVLVVGLGSMGKRRIRNLLSLGYKDIIGFDIRKDRRNEAEKKYGINTVSSISQALKNNPEVMIISTPPDKHSKYANIAIQQNIHFFTEVNLFSQDVKNHIKKLKTKKIVGVPSCTMIFHPVITKLEQLIRNNTIGKILTVHHHYGHYLPNWHPWEDYRSFYVSKKQTGAAKEIVPFELVWLLHLFSNIKSVFGNIEKISNLHSNIDDIYQILLKFKNGVQCVLVVDVFSQPSFSETKIIGEKGTILCYYNKLMLKISHGKKWKTTKLIMKRPEKGYIGNVIADAIYEKEIRSLFDCINKKKKYPLSFSDEFKILKVLDKIELSNKLGKRIILK